jgi:hypothetical protein
MIKEKRMQTLPKYTESLSPQSELLNFDSLAQGRVRQEPYPYLVADHVVSREHQKVLEDSFPRIEQPGFFPLETMTYGPAFEQLVALLQGPRLAEILTEKLNVELRDKPRMITIRKWSAIKDGRIHNDGASKIVTALLYLNDVWGEAEDGGRFRVLKTDRSFDDTAEEVPPLFGNFVAFVRTENSWHGHKPFEGERRVVQIAWLKSWEDFERKHKRGRLSLWLKNLRRRLSI